ncbi:MAG: MYXO-CTERM sorting domain-containing protein, partial [Myxococcales bacterium]|nr:MYXO-CTERM sorting domain-containing protein [Myxococcales bacterium]
NGGTAGGSVAGSASGGSSVGGGSSGGTGGLGAGGTAGAGASNAGTDSVEGGGCGCSTPGQKAPGGLAGLLFALGAVVLRRRRRSAR